MIRTAIIGTGNAARLHLDALRAEGADMHAVAIAGRDPSKTVERAAAAGVSALTPAEATAAPYVDAVILAVPASVQAALAITAFEAGKHVLCEKPLAASLAEARAIASAARAAGTVGMVNFCYRLVPAIAEFRRLLDSGVCGELSSVDVQWVLSSRLDSSLPFNWKADASAGGGALRNFGSHIFDYLFHGKTASVKAAWERTLTPTRLDMAGRRRPVTGHEVFTAIFDVAGWCPVTVHVSLVTRPQLGHRLCARGSLGTLEAWNCSAHSPAGPFRCVFRRTEEEGRGDEAESPGDVDLSTLFRPVHLHFASAILRKTAARPGIDDGVAAMRIVDAVAAAASAWT